MGRKRLRIDSKLLSNMRAKRYIGKDDRISRLPDDILVDILSLLSLNEAARTSVLSSRWINLWKHTNCLNLDGDSTVYDKVSRNYEIKDKLIEIEGPKYVKWVNGILQSHKAPALKEFRLRFFLDIKDEKFITQWLEFAFSRHVQKLELDLRADWDSANYCFPEELLTAPSDSPPLLLDFKPLRALLFTSVDVTDRAIDLFLHNCPLLEQLVVHSSRMLSNVEVYGSSLVLKHLEIVSCDKMKSLKVSAPSLTYLKVARALRGALVLENAPMLVEAYIQYHGDNIDTRRLFSTLSSGAPQLEILHLRVVRQKGKIGKLPQLPKLNKLFIEQVFPDPDCLVRIADLIRASPCLEELVVKIQWYDYSIAQEYWVVNDAINKSPHHHLKVVKYSGYYGLPADLQLVSYILENCVALEKLIIDPLDEKFRNNAKNLEARAPRHIEFVII